MNQNAARAAILFSGGDAPGMNPLLRAFVRLGVNRHDAGVFGIKNGYLGLVRTCQQLAPGPRPYQRILKQITKRGGSCGLHDPDQTIVQMDHASVSGLVSRGGIVLGSSRCPEFLDAKVRREVIKLLNQLGVDAIVVVGGDGSLKGAQALARESGLRVVGVPATIDNDLPQTELALGVDTAVSTVVWAVQRFSDTAGSHHRIMVLEAMGRGSGELAERAALASGAELAVTPERGPLDQTKMQKIAARLEEPLRHGRRHAIVLIAEGVALPGSRGNSPAKVLADYLQSHFAQAKTLPFAVEVRQSVLGHLQRGGPPTASDVLLATDFAEAAWLAITNSDARSGVLGLVRGRMLLQDFAAQPDGQHLQDTQRIYQLQKDISKFRRVEASPDAPRRRRRSISTKERADR